MNSYKEGRPFVLPLLIGGAAASLASQGSVTFGMDWHHAVAANDLELLLTPNSEMTLNENQTISSLLRVDVNNQTTQPVPKRSFASVLKAAGDVIRKTQPTTSKGMKVRAMPSTSDETEENPIVVGTREGGRDFTFLFHKQSPNEDCSRSPTSISASLLLAKASFELKEETLFSKGLAARGVRANQVTSFLKRLAANPASCTKPQWVENVFCDLGPGAARGDFGGSVFLVTLPRHYRPYHSNNRGFLLVVPPAGGELRDLEDTFARLAPLIKSHNSQACIQPIKTLRLRHFGGEEVAADVRKVTGFGSKITRVAAYRASRRMLQQLQWADYGLGKSSVEIQIPHEEFKDFTENLQARISEGEERGFE